MFFLIWASYFHTIIAFFSFLCSYLWHMEVPGLGVKLELQLQAYATAMATPYPSHICNLCHNIHQCQILNPLMRPVSNLLPHGYYIGSLTHWDTMGTQKLLFLINLNKLFSLCFIHYNFFLWSRSKFCNSLLPVFLLIISQTVFTKHLVCDTHFSGNWKYSSKGVKVSSL